MFSPSADRRRIRRDDGKPVHDGLHAATKDNDVNAITPTLETGITHRVEAASASGEFILSIAPQ